ELALKLLVVTLSPMYPGEDLGIHLDECRVGSPESLQGNLGTKVTFVDPLGLIATRSAKSSEEAVVMDNHFSYRIFEVNGKPGSEGIRELQWRLQRLSGENAQPEELNIVFAK
ncbi:unnamed protein product, partial [Polarella glacialis]